MMSFALTGCNSSGSGGLSSYTRDNNEKDNNDDIDNEDDAENCKTNCVVHQNPNYRKSCLEILENGEGNKDDKVAIYPIYLYGSGKEPVNMKCDMSTDGGGWTQITLKIAKEHLNGSILQVDKKKAKKADFDSEFRPYTKGKGDANGKNYKHTAKYKFDIPFGFSEFYLLDYKIKSNSSESAKNHINKSKFVQSDWEKAYESKYSDISFGSPDFESPTTSFATYVVSQKFKNGDVFDWPNNETIYTLSTKQSQFQIGWGANGSYLGWFPWWDGTIWVR